MAANNIAIRLAVVDGQKVKAELRDVGESGQKALKRVEDAARPASVALKMLDGAAGEVQGTLEGMTGRLGAVGGALSALGPIGIAAGAALVAAGAGLAAGIQEAANAERSYRRLEAVLNATGHASGLTGQQITAAAEEMERATLATAEAVQEAAAVLATFRSVSGETFTRTLSLAQDLATVFGQDLSSAAMQLGKALEDPEQGLTALRRVGISFTQSQRELIQTLMDTGQQAEAQRVILDALERQVGGAGAAEAGGLTGATNRLSDAWNNFLEQLGQTPAIAGFVEGALNTISNAIETVTGMIAGARLIRIEPNSLRQVASFGSLNGYPQITFTTTDFGFMARMVVISAYGLNGREDFLYVLSSWGCAGLLKTSDMSYLWGAGGARLGEPDGIAKGFVGEGYGEGWAILTWNWNSYDNCRLYRMRVDVTATVDPITGQTIGVEHRLMATIVPSDLRAGATRLRNRCGGLAYDKSDNSVIFMMEVGDPDQAYVLKWREDLGIVWKTPLPLMINWNANVFDQTRIERGRWTLTRNHRIWQVDTATGALVYDELWPSDIDDWGDQVYDGVTDTLYIWAASGLRKAFLGRGGGAGVALSSIVADLSARAGLDEADINVTELTDTVPGYVIG